MATFARFESDGRTAYGAVENNEIHELRGGLFDEIEPSGRRLRMGDVNLLAPCVPPKIVAVGLNYKSHLGDRKVPDNPEIFYKPISSLQNPGGPVVIPPDALDTHFEGELVVVIGKDVRNAKDDVLVTAYVAWAIAASTANPEKDARLAGV